MVCVPCILIPLFLYVWNKYLAPIFNPILSRLPFIGKCFTERKDENKKSDQKAKCPISKKTSDEGKCPDGEKVEEKSEAPPGWECVDGVCRPKSGNARRRANKAD